MTEIDDFANDKEILRIRREADEYDEMVNESTRIICDRLFLEKASHKNMKPFLMFKTLATPILIDSFRSGNENFPLQVSIVEYSSSIRTPKQRSAGRDLYLFGWLTTKKEFPLTYIYKETLREKIIALFVKGDTDFKEHRKFSSRFYVVTKDVVKLDYLFSNKTLDALTAFPEMEIEINRNECLFRVSRLPVSEEEAKKFVDLARSLHQILG